MTAPKTSNKRFGVGRPGVPWLIVPLVAAAVWVNFPLLSGIVSFSDSSATEDSESESEDESELAEDALIDLTTSTGVWNFVPHTDGEMLPDPFYHPSPGEEAAERAAVPPIALPAVRMVLCSTNSKRALLGNELVRVGDDVGFGSVADIRPNGVVIELLTGGRVTLELPSIGDVERVQAEAADPGSADAPTLGEALSARDQMLKQARNSGRTGDDDQ